LAAAGLLWRIVSGKTKMKNTEFNPTLYVPGFISSTSHCPFGQDSSLQRRASKRIHDSSLLSFVEGCTGLWRQRMLPPGYEEVAMLACLLFTIATLALLPSAFNWAFNWGHDKDHELKTSRSVFSPVETQADGPSYKRAEKSRG
jgi:hypothetical protein